jgi:hypothetical protein
MQRASLSSGCDLDTHRPAAQNAVISASRRFLPTEEADIPPSGDLDLIARKLEEIFSFYKTRLGLPAMDLSSWNAYAEYARHRYNSDFIVADDDHIPPFPASEAAIGALPKRKVDENVECHICLSDIDEATVLPCNHLFHEECICKWLRMHSTCPDCRQSIIAIAEGDMRAYPIYDDSQLQQR